MKTCVTNSIDDLLDYIITTRVIGKINCIQPQGLSQRDEKRASLMKNSTAHILFLCILFLKFRMKKKIIKNQV